MKLVKYAMAGFLAITMVACGPKDSRKSFDDATKYNDYIIDQINELDKMYVTTMDITKGKEFCLAQCDSLTKKAEATIKALNDIQPYEGDSTFAMAAKKFCSYMGGAGKKELPDFINFVMDPNLTPEDEPKISEQADKIDKNYEVQMNNVETVQKALAKKFNFIII